MMCAYRMSWEFVLPVVKLHSHASYRRVSGRTGFRIHMFEDCFRAFAGVQLELEMDKIDHFPSPERADSLQEVMIN